MILIFSTGSTDSNSPINEFTGAWIAGGTGTDEYLEVDMSKPWRYTAVHTQGQDGEAQWVKSYKIQYYDDENSSWVGYNDSLGQDVSIFNSLSSADNLCKQFGPRSGPTNVRPYRDPNCLTL